LDASYSLDFVWLPVDAGLRWEKSETHSSLSQGIPVSVRRYALLKIYAINGSPRKEWNTSTMLDHFLNGAASSGDDVETKMIHLFDLNYTGCRSCFACKLNGPTYGKCSYRDDLYDVLEKLATADGIVFGTPIYFHEITAQLRGLLERFFFQYLSYSKEYPSGAPKKIHTAMIYTMNVTEERMHIQKYPEAFSKTENRFKQIFGYETDVLYAFNTYQFTDYSKYRASNFSEVDKAAYRKTQFPVDCQKAFEAGKRMAAQIRG
jgi:multimeric flavodoxin WrbA